MSEFIILIVSASETVSFDKLIFPWMSTFPVLLLTRWFVAISFGRVRVAGSSLTAFGSGWRVSAISAGYYTMGSWGDARVYFRFDSKPGVMIVSRSTIGVAPKMFMYSRNFILLNW